MCPDTAMAVEGQPQAPPALARAVSSACDSEGPEGDRPREHAASLGPHPGVRLGPPSRMQQPARRLTGAFDRLPAPCPRAPPPSRTPVRTGLSSCFALRISLRADPRFRPKPPFETVAAFREAPIWTRNHGLGIHRPIRSVSGTISLRFRFAGAERGIDLPALARACETVSVRAKGDKALRSGCVKRKEGGLWGQGRFSENRGRDRAQRGLEGARHGPREAKSVRSLRAGRGGARGA